MGNQHSLAYNENLMVLFRFNDPGLHQWLSLLLLSCDFLSDLQTSMLAALVSCIIKRPSLFKASVTLKVKLGHKQVQWGIISAARFLSWSPNKRERKWLFKTMFSRRVPLLLCIEDNKGNPLGCAQDDVLTILGPSPRHLWRKWKVWNIFLLANPVFVLPLHSRL